MTVRSPTVSVVCDEPGCGNTWTIMLAEMYNSFYIIYNLDERCKMAGWLPLDNGKHRCSDCVKKNIDIPDQNP